MRDKSSKIELADSVNHTNFSALSFFKWSAMEFWTDKFPKLQNEERNNIDKFIQNQKETIERIQYSALSIQEKKRNKNLKPIPRQD